MAKPVTFNPIRALVNWAKRAVYEAVARELAEEATDATGYEIEPLELEMPAGIPEIEYTAE